MKKLGENQKKMMERLQKEGKIENIGNFYRNISSKRTSFEALKNFIKYAEELGYKLELGARGGLATAKLYRKGEKMKRFIIRNRETGIEIEWCDTLEDAENKINEYENSDKKDGIYEDNFYEILDTTTNEIL